MAKEVLVAEFLAQRETILQACWAHQLWSTQKLHTADGRRLEVIFQGWLNKGPGPDLTEARLKIGDSEIFGDVEIHYNAAEWKAHGHHRNDGYNRVVLHVLLENKTAGEPAAVLGKDIPVFEMLPHVSTQTITFMRNPEGMLKQYEQLPGRCGLRAASGNPERVNHVIAHAAEERARQKAERLMPRWNEKPEEQTLFELVFQSLGYRPNAQVFRDLAVRFPLADLDVSKTPFIHAGMRGK